MEPINGDVPQFPTVYKAERMWGSVRTYRQKKQRLDEPI
jgi:hypothetical protein